ncbi:sensor histidine kinase [Aggregatilinea lenta]|uniref:sensor histidine kinase n=1 Tax=Aggregatilinea lenta TaxID=913108 RepID=UPI000E5AE7EF|nr:GAF domain-containing sensor histidine kinase [Aggregatilinea lenta]
MTDSDLQTSAAPDIRTEPDDAALAALLHSLSGLLDCPVAALWRAETLDAPLALIAADPACDALDGYAAEGEQTLVGRAFSRQESQSVGEVAGNGEDARLGDLGFRAGLAAPVTWNDEHLGVIAGLDRAEGRTFDAHAVRTIELGAQSAAALIVAERFQAQKQVIETTLHTEQDRLAGLQAAVRRVLEQPDVNVNLIEIAEAYQGLGWEQVILVVYDDNGSADQLITLGVQENRREALREGIVPRQTWSLFGTGQLEQYRVGALYFIPATETGMHWHPDDLLFAPLRLGQGRIVGAIRLGDPVNGLRPQPPVLRVLDVLASQTTYLVENARLFEEKTHALEELADQVEELSMIHRADRELSSHLNMDQVMTLTMDWALRRTGADTGLLALTTQDQRGLVPFTTMGYLGTDILASTEQNPWPLDRGMLGRALTTGQIQIANEMANDDPDALMPGARSQISVPLSMRGEVLGVLSLISSEPDTFGEQNTSFLERLARRAAVALDNARLFRQSEQLADDMAVLYSASRTITATLERDTVLQRIAQSIAVALEASSAVILNYRVDRAEAEVLAVYRVGTARDAQEELPPVKSTVPLGTLEPVADAIKHNRAIVLRIADPSLPEPIRASMEASKVRVNLLLPLVAQDELIGVVLVNESRQDRIFTANEIAKAEALASQASIALRQSMLYQEVLQLDKIKSEMIRMASHDLRNPLNTILGYLDLVSISLEQVDVGPEIKEYMGSLRRSTRTMQSLIDDLLTLERVESERESDWQTFDLAGLVTEVVETEFSSAHLKKQALTYQRVQGLPQVYGSIMQLRQAITNLVGNAIKYTPEGGTIDVTLSANDDQVHLSVTDTGYGISPDRQTRIFERFYRAREPGTETIPGTGLGLSLVKTVVERHGGLVWFESTKGQGSTFHFWLPAAHNNKDR